MYSRGSDGLEGFGWFHCGCGRRTSTATLEKVVNIVKLTIEHCPFIAVAQNLFWIFQRPEDSRRILVFVLVRMEEQRQLLEAQSDLCFCRISREVKDVIVVCESGIRYWGSHQGCLTSPEEQSVILKMRRMMFIFYIEHAAGKCAHKFPIPDPGMRFTSVFVDSLEQCFPSICKH